MLTSWSEVSTPAELSMASVLIRTAVQRPRCGRAGTAEVAALADHLAAQLPAVDPEASLARSPTVGVVSVAALT
jgi:hypothetical protein